MRFYLPVPTCCTTHTFALSPAADRRHCHASTGRKSRGRVYPDRQKLPLQDPQCGFRWVSLLYCEMVNASLEPPGTSVPTHPTPTRAKMTFRAHLHYGFRGWRPMVHSRRGNRRRCHTALVTWKKSFFSPPSVPLRVCRCDYIKVLRSAVPAFSPFSCAASEQTARKDRKPVDIMLYLDTSESQRPIYGLCVLVNCSLCPNNCRHGMSNRCPSLTTRGRHCSMADEKPLH